VILTVDHLTRQAEVSCHIAGKDIVAKSDDADLYAAIDAVADKLDRQIIKYKRPFACASARCAQASFPLGLTG